MPGLGLPGRPTGGTARTAPASTASRPTSSVSSPVPSATIASTPAADPTTASNPAGLTDAQMVGQLFIGYVYGSTATAATASTAAGQPRSLRRPDRRQVVRRWHLGGIILLDHNTLDPARPELSTGNVDDRAQITALTTGLQQAALADSGVQLLIGTDQEGGQVQRITDGVPGARPSCNSSRLDPTSLRCSYQNLGQQLRPLGVNQDYAPVADVVRTAGGVIGDRSFGPDPAVDSRDVLAAVTGLQAAGVLATLKHWPGHGSTPTDSHEALPVLTESAAQWPAMDRPPFQAAAKVAGSVMVGHLALPALDPSGQPATLSPF